MTAQKLALWHDYYAYYLDYLILFMYPNLVWNNKILIQGYPNSIF